jgi:hypothetical protein
MADLVERPGWVGTWAFIIGITALCGAAFLWTGIGTQAVVDERVRVVEAFGGVVDDETYAAWQARPPRWIYVTSGGRLFLTPAVTLLTAAVLWFAARLHKPSTRFTQALAIAVHATVALAIGQVVATPIHFIRESLTSPFTLASVLPINAGTFAARLLGAIDLFALWWLALLAIGLAALTGRAARTYFLWLAAGFLGIAGVLAAIMAASGGI